MARYGKSPLPLRGMNESELASLAALADDQSDIRERVRAILVEYYESRKATDEDTDQLPSEG